ncbi:MAG: DUF4136 domain-containing protein [Reichenbachiella sp.]
MRLFTSYGIITLALINCFSCATTKTISFINDDMDLRDYETFKLITVNTDDENFSVSGMVFFSELEKAIYRNMDKRLFDKSNKPDIIVRYELVSNQRTESSRNMNYYSPYSYYTPSPTVVRNYTEGILIIEFRDRKKKKLVWQGSLDLEYTRGDDPDDVIVDAVNEIFTTYPYQAGSYNEINLGKKKK